MSLKHAALQSGRWQELSLAEQLGNIGSEINRALMYKNEDCKRFQDALFRALELLDFTLADRRWRRRLKEIARVREITAAQLERDSEYGTTLEDLNRYFFQFAMAARQNK